MTSLARNCWRPTLRWSGNIRRVLVVEDDPDHAVLLKDYLESYFYRVTVVTNGVGALQVISETDPDVIICDMVMPRMAGDMFYRAVGRIKPHLCDRFIFITAHPEHPRVKEFLNHAANLVLMKPFHLDDLLEMILLLFRELENPITKLTVPEGRAVAVPIDQPAVEQSEWQPSL